MPRHAANALDAHIGKRVRSLRIRREKSQESLAAELDISQPVMNEYEHGRQVFSAQMLWKLHKELQVPIAYFFESYSR